MTGASQIVHADLDYICGNLATEFQQLAGRKVLVVGGAGFLGYYLVQSVLHWNKSHDPKIHVTVFDNYIRGIPDWLRTLQGDTHLSLVRHDITEPLPPAMESFDYIVHAASIASPIFYRKHPLKTMDANVNGLRILLDYCVAQKEKGQSPRGFLFFSTSEIYGDPTPENIPTPETYRGNVSCTGPRACYDESKRYGETLCVTFAQQYDLPVKIVRPFNNYGPGLKITDRRVIPDFARDILAGRDIVLLSDGSPTRTFCYVADAVVGYFKALVIGRSGEAYNIGVESPEISMANLAERLIGLGAQHVGYKGKLVRQVSPDRNYLVDNPNRRCPVISKSRTELNYNPSISLETGLERSLLWYRENNEASEA
jgi:nucleoside-diphosphate-sugar epimerase